jgi:hypothetical protein
MDVQTLQDQTHAVEVASVGTAERGGITLNTARKSDGELMGKKGLTSSPRILSTVPEVATLRASLKTLREDMAKGATKVTPELLAAIDSAKGALKAWRDRTIKATVREETGTDLYARHGRLHAQIMPDGTVRKADDAPAAAPKAKKA